MASTTLCSFKSPAATTTLAFASVQIRTATTTATVVNFGKSVFFDATTTLIGVPFALGSFEQGTVTNASSTVFSPNDYLNVKFGGTRGSVNALVGSCKAEFIVN